MNKYMVMKRDVCEPFHCLKSNMVRLVVTSKFGNTVPTANVCSRALLDKMNFAVVQYPK